jgi:hypothetical protein
MANQEPLRDKLTIAQEKDVMGVTERRDFPVLPCGASRRPVWPGRRDSLNQRQSPYQNEPTRPSAGCEKIAYRW